MYIYDVFRITFFNLVIELTNTEKKNTELMQTFYRGCLKPPSRYLCRNHRVRLYGQNQNYDYFFSIETGLTHIFIQYSRLTFSWYFNTNFIILCINMYFYVYLLQQLLFAIIHRSSGILLHEMFIFICFYLWFFFFTCFYISNALLVYFRYNNLFF